MQSSFIDSRMNPALTANFHPSKCTIQVYTDGVDAYGTPTETWANLAGHVDIPCSVQLSSGRETKLASNEYGITTHRIALNGVYPAITRLHHAVVDGTTYEIQYASPPGHANSITVLFCDIASGGS